MPTFCRHGRFVERCPVCSKTLPGNEPAQRASGGSRRRAPGAGAGGRAAGNGARRGAGAAGLRVSRQQRAVEDGYVSPLLPGVRASADAERLAVELAFSAGRLLALATAPPEGPPQLYAEIRALAASDVEQAIWACFLTAYVCPTEDRESFAGIRRALQVPREELADLDAIELGPRSSHERARGDATLRAYRGWYAQAGSQAAAFAGDRSWTPERRFERVFERLALPGLTRTARYELLVLLGTLAVCELRAGSLQLAGARGGAEDATALAAKRVFAIGDPLLLERRAAALAEAVPVPIGALELALWNWGSEQRATLGFALDVADADTLELARAALGL